jgi:hypothetical protein
MYEWVNSIRGEVEPIDDPIYGSLYRCSLTLKDGAFLPCAVIQPRQRLVDLAKRRIKEELEGKGRLGGDDPYGQIVTSFVTRGNRVNDYDVASSCVSKPWGAILAKTRCLLGRLGWISGRGLSGWRRKNGVIYSAYIGRRSQVERRLARTVVKRS